MNSEATNAVAGPSNSRASPPVSSLPTPHLFLPPPGPPQTHPTYLSSTQDLLTRFNLLPAYDKYVRPFTSSGEPCPSLPAPVNGLDKGKGKEIVGTPGTPGVPDAGDGDDDEGAGGKNEKKRNNYKHLIKGVPGKHSMKKDDYLVTMMQVPPKQRMQITPFDIKAQREAFTVSLEGLKGWNPNALVLLTAQAREDRKRRKEIKRLQKLQAQAQAQAPSLVHPQPIQAPVPTSAITPSLNRPTPIPAPVNSMSQPTSVISRPTSVSAAPTVQRPGSTVPRPGSAAHKPVARPGSTVPRPGSTVPRPGSIKPVPLPAQAPVGTPLKPGIGPGTPLRNTGAAASTVSHSNPHSIDWEKRGIKRERDDVGGTASLNGTAAANNNGIVSTSPQKTTAILNAKAGMAGVRPRPIKKQRMDMQGQARDMAVTQQPTPQGV